MRILVLPAALLLVFLLAACGSTGEGGDVELTLDEWSVVTDVDTLPEGPIKFDIKNAGEREHELLIVRSDIPGAELPTKDNGSFDDDAGGVDVKHDIDGIEGGDVTSRSYLLDPGNYVLLCNIVEDIDGAETSHYAQGMWTEFTITPDE
ncbi:MAG: hypothetical protein IIA90_03150 [Chloroflexi bacterium]|nr:hypothetical protein [Chloroflexota bacterium]